MADSTPVAPEPATPTAAKAAPLTLATAESVKPKSVRETSTKSPAPPRVRRSLRDIVERYLRDKGIPYINVDEAKKALFAGAKLRSFHFVVYRTTGQNWLLYTSQLRKESRDDLRQWEGIFGDGFVAVIGKQAVDGTLKFRTLKGESVELP